MTKKTRLDEHPDFVLMAPALFSLVCFRYEPGGIAASGLDSLNQRLLEAVNGRQALEISRESLPDLIISDVHVPQMTGNELCQAIAAEPELSFIPVILLTSQAGTRYKLEGLEKGAADFLVKPFEIKELLARVRALRRRSESNTKDSPFHPSQISHQGARSHRAHRGLDATDKRWVRYLFRQSRRMATGRQPVTS